MLRLTEEDLIPLLLLETLFRAEHIPLTRVPTIINNDLRMFDRRNLWCGFLSFSFSTNGFNKHKEEVYDITIKIITLLHYIFFNHVHTAGIRTEKRL